MEELQQEKLIWWDAELSLGRKLHWGTLLLNEKFNVFQGSLPLTEGEINNDFLDNNPTSSDSSNAAPLQDSFQEKKNQSLESI